MNANGRITGIFVVFFVAIIATSQESAKKGADPPIRAVAIFRDGDIWNVTILQEDLKVVTKYGELTIPFGEVQKIDFGLHYPDDMEKKIGNFLDRLGNDAYKEREEAQKFLIGTGHLGYPMIKKTAEEPGDLERTKRAKSILKQIKEKVPAELLKLKTHDVVYATEFMVEGRVDGTAFRAHSRQAGNLNLKFSELLTFHGNNAGKEQKFEVDALKYGGDQWLETNVMVRPNTRLKIAASGQVDLWPQTPGQYMIGPKGYTSAGKGNFMAGSLIGRIGPLGKAFFIGEHCECAPSEEGALFLQIVPSPWNNPSLGSYAARVTTNYKFP